MATNVNRSNIIFVAKWSSRCGNCLQNITDFDLRECPRCGTTFEACVAEYMYGSGLERVQCGRATGLPCIGIGDANSGEYEPYPG